jgi:thiamine-monophosphate kinase
LAALRAGFRLRDDQVVAPSEVSADLKEAIHRAIERHLCPIPRLREGRALAEAGVATAMIDLSDGLASDLWHLCRESGVSARIREDQIPIDPAALAIGRYLGKDPLLMALEGGEDFELLFASSSDPAEIHALFSDGMDVTEVGGLEQAGRGCVLERRGGDTVPLTGGYDHFRQQ